MEELFLLSQNSGVGAQNQLHSLIDTFKMLLKNTNDRVVETTLMTLGRVGK